MPDIYVNDEGILRKLKRLYVNNLGNTLIQIKQVWVNDEGVLRLVFDGLIIQWVADSNQLKGFNNGGNCTGNIWLNHDGTTQAGADNEYQDTLTGDDWHNKAPAIEEDSDPWTIKMTHTGGQNMTFTGLAEDTEYTLDQTRLFTVVNQNMNSEGIGLYDLTIDDKAGTIVVKSLTLELQSGTPP